MNTPDTEQEIEETANWVKEEFVTTNIGDIRLNARLSKIAEAFMQSPGASIPKAANNWGGAKGVYRFLKNDKVNPHNIISPHTESTMKRIKNRKLILAIQDTSAIDYSHRPFTEGIGPGGNREARGLFLHPTLAVTPEGTPHGILDLQIWKRDEVEWSEQTKEQRRNRKIPVEERESMKWINSYRKVCEIQKKMKDEVHFVNICDREGDMYDLFLEHHKLYILNQNPPDLLVRAAHNRKLYENPGNLWSFVKSLDSSGEYDIQVPRKVGKKARQTTLEVRFSKVTLKRPVQHNDHADENTSLELYAIHTCEKNPPDKEEPITWMLLTTMPISTLEDAVEKIEWYADRWIIETFFKILKSGCKIEDRQLRHGNGLMSCMAIDCVIAWRILFLTFIGRELPGLSADVIFERYEWECLHCRTFNTSEVPGDIPTLYTVIIQIAKLAGFLARKGDGYPGPITMFRGMLALNEMVSIYKILRPDSTCG